MLGRKDRHQAHPGSVEEDINGASALAIAAGLIGDQADAVPDQRSEVFLLQYINPGQRLVGMAENSIEPVRPVVSPAPRAAATSVAIRERRLDSAGRR